VQRVLENTQLYRNRLAGSDQALMLMADLGRGTNHQLARADDTPAVQ
jgi:hypothetical protein